MARYSDAAPQYNAGDKVYFYEPGTTTLKATYSDTDETIANPNPVICDANGFLPDVILVGTYDIKRTDADDVTIWTRDNVGSVVTGEWQTWQAGTVYNIPDLVKASDDAFYRSSSDANQGNDPTSSPANWDKIELLGFYNSNTTYSTGDRAIGSDGLIYYSLSSGNTGNNPSTDTTNAKWMASDQTRVADASGTVDALAATFIPAVGALREGLMVRVKASGANTIINPTFSPNGLTAKEIVIEGGNALKAGSIRGADHELLLSFDSVNDQWELINPSINAELAAIKAESSAFTMVSGGLITWAHGLGAKPFSITAYVKCLTAEQGYAIGDEVEITLVNNTWSGGDIANGVYTDATNVNVRWNNAGTGPLVGNKSTGVAGFLTLANWELYLRASL